MDLESNRTRKQRGTGSKPPRRKVSVSAYGQLGALYHNGNGHPRDVSTALHWYRGGATRGDAASLFGLGLLYQNGDGVRANDHTAANYYRMAAERGYRQSPVHAGGHVSAGARGVQGSC